MIALSVQVSTGEAAELVHVHESTIKRWCDAGELDVSLTAGGHRRITLSSLLVLASKRDLNARLLDFGNEAERVYVAMTQALTGDYELARVLVYDAARDRRAAFGARFLRLVLARGVEPATVLDEITAPVLRRMGDEWSCGTLEVGDEHVMTGVVADMLRYVRGAPLAGSTERRAIVGALSGNCHLMGAEMVRMVLEDKGWDVIYLGGDTPVSDFISQQRRHRAELVCISLTPPQIAADAKRTCETMGLAYDASAPFRLAFGGEPMRDDTTRIGKDLPFTDCSAFANLEDFARWLK